MNTTATIQELEKLFQRAIKTTNDDLDVTGLDGFCTHIQNDNSLINGSITIIATKIQSTNIKESINSLCVLEECMERCGPEFQSIIGKFRFLNVLIRLVSKKYLGDETPKIIRDKILDLLLNWTIQYPNELKIKEAYDMLRNQGVAHEPTKNIKVDQKNGSTFSTTTTTAKPAAEDQTSIRLKKLLQSKNPNDLQAANLIIQNMVKEDERRMQMKSLRLTKLQKVKECVDLLNSMIDEYETNETSEDILDTINSLKASCEELQPTILQLAQETQETEESLEDILQTNDNLSQVFEKYELVIAQNKPNSVKTTAPKTAPKPQSNTDLLSSLESFPQNIETTLMNDGMMSTNINRIINTNSNHLSDIRDIFSELTNTNELLNNEMQLLKPQNINLISDSKNSTDKPTKDILSFHKNEIAGAGPSPKINNKDLRSAGYKQIPDLDMLINGMKDSLLSKTEIVKEIIVIEDESSNDDENMLMGEIEMVVVPPPPTIVEKIIVKSEIKSLAGIEIDLDKIIPGNEPSRTIMDDSDGLKVIFNFAKDIPCPDVSVIVISIINQGREPISKFQFDASVTKPCKLRLLKSSGDYLPGVKPFRPPADDITQVLLLSNPTKTPVNMICILSYCVGDDVDPVRDPIEVKNLPYLID